LAFGSILRRKLGYAEGQVIALGALMSIKAGSPPMMER
jgi:hypothetical protein